MMEPRPHLAQRIHRQFHVRRFRTLLAIGALANYDNVINQFAVDLTRGTTDQHGDILQHLRLGCNPSDER